jgi:hypothetical protein
MTPAQIGPSNRVNEFDIVSKASARDTNRPSTHSPTMRRRVAISVDHTTPATNAATATCHGSATPANASSATDAEARHVTACPHTSTTLRSTASVTTPENAPSSNIGMVRAADTTATANPDPVTSNVNSAAANTSNQRIVFTHPPIAQSRRNARDPTSACSPFGINTTVTAEQRPPARDDAPT